MKVSKKAEGPQVDKMPIKLEPRMIAKATLDALEKDTDTPEVKEMWGKLKHNLEQVITRYGQQVMLDTMRNVVEDITKEGPLATHRRATELGDKFGVNVSPIIKA